MDSSWAVPLEKRFEYRENRYRGNLERVPKQVHHQAVLLDHLPVFELLGYDANSDARLIAESVERAKSACLDVEALIW